MSKDKILYAIGIIKELIDNGKGDDMDELNPEWSAGWNSALETLLGLELEKLKLLNVGVI